ncbi:hypothetical protein F5148DRAFT_302905 [Russula earlei]|uniref:Uncharacterized protein n=1 Tax=Russula earlei TaxID=71964 RepID=A0ACC0UJ35_9AGAM|nr:hypothetical protein F5148DRAFT_302905 [Russula earlei]
MDDLWGNAWGSPDDLTDNKPRPSWSTSDKLRSENDDLQEDDLSAPSWSTTGPGIRWDEPSDAQTSLWTNTHHATRDWSLENPYGGISLGNSRTLEPPDDKHSSLELIVEPDSSPQAQSDNVSPPFPSTELDGEALPSPIPSSATSSEPSPPSSPDAFGTFTVGTEHSDAAPFPAMGDSRGGQLDDNEWGSPWRHVTNDVDESATQHVSDEWESAKLRKLEMDRRVPPELLSQILLHLEELSKDAWPEIQDMAEEDWQKRWHSGMDVDGLDNLLLRYIPALTLPLLPSGKSFTTKAMADALKLSRNTALTRTSPMSMFLAAKGSTAWEASVKSRVETSVDEVPSGWRILDKDPKKDEKPEERVKKSSGLLAGLWGRRTTSSPSNPPSLEQSTPSPSATAPEASHAVQAPSQLSTTDGANTSQPTSQILLQSPHVRTPSQDDDTHVLPPGSAVSRFLQRFSRPRSSRNSLALSNDDLEFLSDVRSNSSDPVHPVDGLMAGLGSASESAENDFLQQKLPPTLPPPPNISAPPSRGPATPNEDSLISLSDPHANVITTLQSPIEEPTTLALTPHVPTLVSESDSPQPISFKSALSQPLSSEEKTPSLGGSLLPVLSSRSISVVPSLPVVQPQRQLESGKPFDMSQDDDFSDFCSSPADSSLLSFNISSPSSGQGKVASALSSQQHSNSPFDDLAQLMSSTTTSPLSAFEYDGSRPSSFVNPTRSMASSPPSQRESAPAQRAGLDLPDTNPDRQRPTSPTRVTPTSPKRQAIAEEHQRTQSLLNLAASRRGRWPSPPSPLPPPLLLRPPPSGKSAGEGAMNVDYFGTTPVDASSILSSPSPPKNTSLLPSFSNSTSPVGSSRKDWSPATNSLDAIARPPSGSPSSPRSAPPPGLSARRGVSPPLPAAIMNASKRPSKSSTPVPLLPPPGGYGFAASPMPSFAQLSPESTPLALLIERERGKNVNIPAAKPTPPASVKGTGGLSAQDLSFFEGL